MKMIPFIILFLFAKTPYKNEKKKFLKDKVKGPIFLIARHEMKNCQVIFEKSIFANLKNLLNQKDLFLRNSCPPSMLKAHTFDSLKQVLDCNRDREYFSKGKKRKNFN